ncbi:CWH41 [Candida theae]|uniref:Mannosyl-oligosaccharide glucosidase n=1 Tax=Candida theae TaxID=1198502 RepID=A0AAD5BFY3_9ASCO|nr:CWH41 [Candida theae]KAI5958652.1 CWH41 [Candida theae]
MLWRFWSPFLLISYLFTFSLAEQIKFDIYGEENSNNNSHNYDSTNTLASQYATLADNSLLWGPYRSSLYFGIRPRIPKSLLSGLMWFPITDYQSIGKIRHFYEQFDRMGKANWVSYDPRIGGRQLIQDDESHFDIIIDFIKSQEGLSWAVKIKAEPHKGYENSIISFVWYSGLEGEKDQVDEITGQKERSGHFRLDANAKEGGYDGVVKFSGISEELGAFTLDINDGPKSNKHPKGKSGVDKELDPALTHHLSLTVPDGNVWQARDIFVTILQDSVKSIADSNNGQVGQLPPENLFIVRDMYHFEGNLHFVQKIYQGACEFDVIYSNAYTPKSNALTFDNLQGRIDANLQELDKVFAAHFQIQPPFNTKSYYKFAKEMLSGLLGGITYMYGDHLVDRETVFDEDTFESYQLKGSFEGPYELFTLVPSRPFFPRGFYWDEGFHLLPLLNYDSDLVLDIVKSWFHLIDEDGWIAREQILGTEARSRVPKEFQVQSPHIVNPPTLTLVLSKLLDFAAAAGKSNKQSVDSFGDVNEPVDVDAEDLSAVNSIDDVPLGKFILNNPEVLLNYTKDVFPKLKSHFEMFQRTQQGYVANDDDDEEAEEEEEEGRSRDSIRKRRVYRWRGSTFTHCLASGIDDYPRSSPPDIADLNIDLISWIGVMARSLRQMAEILGKDDSEVHGLKQFEQDVVDNIQLIHWSAQDDAYCDVTLNEDDELVHVCHKGYVSLLPFMTKLIPVDDVTRLDKVINLITDPDALWSPFGIRSLSKSDEFYRTGENYWRSPIWIHMNYLILQNIKDYYHDSSSHMSDELKKKFSDAYSNLRLNLVKNVYKQWQKTGFVWEQYDEETGDAKGAKNFLGWTSTILLIMTMPERI